MEKFSRYRRDLDEHVDAVSTEGVIRTISPTAKQNTNGKLYYTFTADVNMPNGSTMLVLGQVYESSFDFLGDKPRQGESFIFAIEKEQLMAGNNKVWYILGHAIDEIDESHLDQIENLFDE